MNELLIFLFIGMSERAACREAKRRWSDEEQAPIGI